VDAEPVLDVGAEVLDNDVRLLDELVEDVECTRVLEVERDAAFVGVEVLEVEAVALVLGALLLAGSLYLDDLGAEVAELADTGRTGARAGQVDDTDMGQRQVGVSHRFAPRNRLSLWERAGV